MAANDYVGPIADLVITGASAFFTGEILDVTSMSADITEVDISPGHATSGHGEYAYGARVSIEMQIKSRWDPATDYLALIQLAPAQTDITFRDDANTKHRYSLGKVHSFSAALPATGRIEADCTIRLAGTRTVNPV